MRRVRDPGMRKPSSSPRSKQRMIVCCDTLQSSAASPVEKRSLSVRSLLALPLLMSPLLGQSGTARANRGATTAVPRRSGASATPSA